MKFRTDFVTNSSSASFVVSFIETDEGQIELMSGGEGGSSDYFRDELLAELGRALEGLEEKFYIGTVDRCSKEV